MSNLLSLSYVALFGVGIGWHFLLSTTAMPTATCLKSKAELQLESSTYCHPFPINSKNGGACMA